MSWLGPITTSPSVDARLPPSAHAFIHPQKSPDRAHRPSATPLNAPCQIGNGGTAQRVNGDRWVEVETSPGFLGNAEACPALSRLVLLHASGLAWLAAMICVTDGKSFRETTICALSLLPVLCIMKFRCPFNGHGKITGGFSPHISMACIHCDPRLHRCSIPFHCRKLSPHRAGQGLSPRQRYATMITAASTRNAGVSSGRQMHKNHPIYRESTGSCVCTSDIIQASRDRSYF